MDDNDFILKGERVVEIITGIQIIIQGCLKLQQNLCNMRKLITLARNKKEQIENLK